MTVPGPGEPSLRELHSEAQRLIAGGKFGAAEQVCLDILKRDPAHSDAQFLLSIISAASGRLRNGVELIQKAIKLDGRRPEFHAHLARCLAMQRRDAEAVVAADWAAALGAADPLTLDTLGVVYMRAGEYAKAAQVLGRASTAQPGNAGFQYNLGSALQALGRLDEAEHALTLAVRLNPKLSRAHLALALLRTQTEESNHVERLEGLLPSIETPADELVIRQALVKEYEDLGEYDRAFTHLTHGNARKRGAGAHSLQRERELFECAERLLPLPAAAGFESAEPIFVMGMPRSGLALAERMLSAHPDVCAAGDHPNFGLALKRAAGTHSTELLDVATLEEARHVNFAELGRDYIASTRPATGHTPHFVDRMPFNYFYFGFIRRALPQAKLICLHRHPLDICLSNYRQLSAPHQHGHLSSDLLDCGRHYLMFRRLVQRWRDLLPGSVMEMEFEELVGDPSAAGRRLQESCKLEFEPGWLGGRTSGPSAAPGAAMHGKAVGRWKHYKEHLAPLIDLLDAEGVAI